MSTDPIPAPYGPVERAYGTIGPNVFQLWCQWARQDPTDVVGERGQGILNGFEFPHSMARCHEGHLVALLGSVEFWLSIGSTGNAAAWLKVLLAERPNRHLMTYDIEAVFERAEVLFDHLLSEVQGVAEIDICRLFDHQFGADWLTRLAPALAPVTPTTSDHQETAPSPWPKIFGALGLLGLAIVVLRGC